MKTQTCYFFLPTAMLLSPTYSLTDSPESKCVRLRNLRYYKPQQQAWVLANFTQTPKNVATSWQHNPGGTDRHQTPKAERPVYVRFGSSQHLTERYLIKFMSDSNKPTKKGNICTKSTVSYLWKLIK